ncbi:MAG TPA: hypothetical protein VLB90_11485, partial [Pseudomonadales bacterium]|nr:hypothetical protein [Pseudomonadales bacterium]
MKKIIIFAAAVLSGALTLSAQAAPPVFGAGYANPEFWINNALIKQSLSLTGCKTVSMPAKKTTLSNGNATLFDDGSFVLLVDWS